MRPVCRRPVPAQEASRVEADVVIGAPDSGLDAALGRAQESGIPLWRGLYQEQICGRTFIQGSQAQRESSVRIKLNAITSTVKGQARCAGR